MAEHNLKAVVQSRSFDDFMSIHQIITLNSSWPRRSSEISTISTNSYACSPSGPSRFEIVQRQLEQQRKIATESQYYMQTVSSQIVASNIYESSSQSPYSEAPTRPASYAQVIKPKLESIEQEPENYYSNVELMYVKN